MTLGRSVGDYPPPKGDPERQTIAVINVGGWQAAFREIIPEDFLDQMDPEKRESFVDQMISNGAPYHVAVADDQGAVVGYVMLGPPVSEDLDVSTVHELYSPYIEPDRIGTGLGRSLMDNALQYLRNGEWAYAVLWTLQDAQRTSRFYEKAGWYLDGAERTEEIPEGSPVVEVRYPSTSSTQLAHADQTNMSGPRTFQEVREYGTSECGGQGPRSARG